MRLHGLNDSSPRSLDPRHRPLVVRRTRNVRGFAGGRVRPDRDALDGARRRGRPAGARDHPAHLREGGESRRQAPLRGLPHAYTERRDLLPRPSANDPARRGRSHAHDEASKVKRQLVVIAGPTGTGKSDLAQRLAQSVDGEIVNYDSVQIYRGFDIGSAKPSASVRATVPHHLFDIVDAGEEFTAADYQQVARRTCEAILERGKLPILVGG